MPPRGNEWLALTAEPTLEPDLPICDPHHHFWVQRPEPVDYQQYLLPDLVADITSGHNVRSTVFIEARSEYRTDGPEELRSVGESSSCNPSPTRARAGATASPARRRHHWPRRPETRRRRAARAGGVAGGQPQPVPRHPPLGRVGTRIRRLKTARLKAVYSGMTIWPAHERCGIWA